MSQLFQDTYYNIYFEAAATIIIALFLVIYVSRNKLHTVLNKTFAQLLIFNFLASVLDIATAIINDSQGYFLPWVEYLYNILYFASSASLGYFIFKYVATLVHRTKYITRRGMNLAKLPLAVYFVILVSTPFTGLIFSFDSEGNYIHGTLYVLVYAMLILYLLFCYYLMIRYHKSLSAGTNAVLWLTLLVLTVGSMALQAVVIPNVLLTYFATAVTLIILYTVIMVNDSYFRKDTGLLNDVAFYLMAAEKYEYEQGFDVRLFKIHEYYNCTKIHGMQVTTQVMSEMQKSLCHAAGKSNVYQVTDDIYAVLMESKISPSFVQRQKKIDEFFDWLCEPIIVGNARVNLNPTQIRFICPDDAEDYESFHSMIDYIIETAPKTVDTRSISVADDIKNKFENERNVFKALSRALENDSLQIYLQPIYSIVDKKIVSAEVLCRMIDDDMGFVPPDVFIPVAEKMNVIQALDNQVFRKTCAFIKDSGIVGKSGLRSLKVNLSPIQCNNINTADELIEMANSYGVDMSLLELELTESAANDGNQAIRSNMEKLKVAGAKLALDDYGTGYSNLVSIIQLPFDYIKIDKSILWSRSKHQSTPNRPTGGLFKIY